MELYDLSNFSPIARGMFALAIALYVPGWLAVRHFRLCELQLVGALFVNPIVLYVLVSIFWLVGINPSTKTDIILISLVGVIICSLLVKRPKLTFEVTTFQVVYSVLGFTAVVLVFSQGVFDIWRLDLFGSDGVHSWNRWAQIWSTGSFPDRSYGYPQLIPTVWSVPYWFMGPEGQYYARLIHLSLIILPLISSGMVLAKHKPIGASLALAVYCVLILLISNGWLGSTLSAGFVDWTAATFVLAGLLLIATYLENSTPVIKVELWIFSVLVFVAAFLMKSITFVYLVFIFAAFSLGVFKKNLTSLFAVAVLCVIFLMIYAFQQSNVVNTSLPPFKNDQGVVWYFENMYMQFDRAYRFFPLVPVVLLASLVWLALNGKRLLVLVALTVVGLGMWSIAAAYDIRAALPFIHPIVCLAACLVGVKLDQSWSIGSWGAAVQRHSYISLGIAMLFIALLWLPIWRDDKEQYKYFSHDELNSYGISSVNNHIFELIKDRNCDVHTSEFYMSAINIFKMKTNIFARFIGTDENFINIFNRSKLNKNCKIVVHKYKKSNVIVPNFLEKNSDYILSKRVFGTWSSHIVVVMLK